jgi:hypothetical protein
MEQSPILQLESASCRFVSDFWYLTARQRATRGSDFPHVITGKNWPNDNWGPRFAKIELAPLIYFQGLITWEFQNTITGANAVCIFCIRDKLRKFFVVHGVLTNGTTSFPQIIGIGASFNISLVSEMAKVNFSYHCNWTFQFQLISTEARAVFNTGNFPSIGGGRGGLTWVPSVVFISSSAQVFRTKHQYFQRSEVSYCKDDPRDTFVWGGDEVKRLQERVNLSPRIVNSSHYRSLPQWAVRCSIHERTSRRRWP